MTRWSVTSTEWRKVRAPPSLSMAVARQGIANSSIFLMHAILGIDKAMVGIKFFDEEQLRIEPRAGRVVIFSSGHENPHKVERVLSGQRFVLAFWFTCDKRRAFQVFLDGAAHSAFSEEFADDLKKKAGHSEVPTQRPETAAAKKRRRRKSNSGGPRAENDAEL